MLDLAIRGGTVVDGTGAPARIADVGCRDGVVVAVGELDEPTARTVHADGLVVAPGFVDVHAHYDAQLFWDSTCAPSPLHGITTTIAGNCGLTLAPKEGDEEFLARLLARVESIPATAMAAGVQFRWHTYAEFLDTVDRPLALNLGFMVGHAAVRRLVMGERASSDRATTAEIAAMHREVTAALSSGAFGLSSSTVGSHVDGDGRPAPPQSASADEFIALAAACGEFAGTSLEFIPGSFLWGFDDADLDLMARMSLAANRPLNWNTIQVVRSDPELHERQMRSVVEADRRGACVVPLMIPHNSRNRVDFGPSNGGLRLIPGWEWLFELSPNDRVKALRDPATRSRLSDLYQQANAGFALVIKETMASWVINDSSAPPVQALAGRTLGSIAAERRCEPLDLLLDLAIEARMELGMLRARFGDDPWVHEQRARMVSDRRVVLGASDGGAHVDASVNVEYPTACLKELVREEAIFTLEGLVHQLTAVPAALYGLQGRGAIRPGFVADFVVFDPATVAPDALRLADDFPGGAYHLVSDAVGIDRVIVAGRDVVVDGAFTGDLPGRLLRSGQDSVTPRYPRPLPAPT